MKWKMCDNSSNWLKKVNLVSLKYAYQFYFCTSASLWVICNKFETTNYFYFMSIILAWIIYYFPSGMSSRNTNFSMKVFSNNILDESSNLTRSLLSLEAVCCRHCYSLCLPDLMSSAFYLLCPFLDSFRDRRNICAAQRSKVSSSRLTTARCMSLKSRTEKIKLRYYVILCLN